MLITPIKPKTIASPKAAINKTEPTLMPPNKLVIRPDNKIFFSLVEINYW